MMNQLGQSMNELNISRNGNNEMQQEMFQYESFCNVLYDYCLVYKYRLTFYNSNNELESEISNPLIINIIKINIIIKVIYESYYQ